MERRGLYNLFAVGDCGSRILRQRRLSVGTLRLLQSGDSAEGKYITYDQNLNCHPVNEDRLEKEHRIEEILSELKTAEVDPNVKARVIEGVFREIQGIHAREHSRIKVLEQKIVAKNEVLKGWAVERNRWRGLWGGIFEPSYRLSRLAPRPGFKVLYPKSAGSKPVVAIDVMQLVPGVSGGVETYMRMLARAIESTGRYQIFLLTLDHQAPALQNEFGSKVGYVKYEIPWVTRSLVRAANFLYRSRNNHLGSDLALVSFSDLATICGAKILHSPVQLFSTFDFSIPAVLNLHDLQHLHFPEDFSARELEARNKLYTLSANLADAVLTSSDFVRHDVIDKMRIDAEKVFSVPVTANPQVLDGLKQFPPNEARERYRLPEIYGFYPAHFWPHKNHLTLVRALRIVRERNESIDLKLVFTGFRGHSGWSKVAEELNRLNLKEHVLILDHIPVDHLAAIYRSARFCVVPSLFEASSYPVIEAQLLGCPVMCSNVTSLPELVRGGSGLLFDPRSEEDLAEKMERWLRNPDDAQSHAERARERALKEHGMEGYAEKLLAIYDAILSR
jgi:glycosyltransferase involved in cell wall biosynthesis